MLNASASRAIIAKVAKNAILYKKVKNIDVFNGFAVVWKVVTL
jgi:hypothetical protein